MGNNVIGKNDGVINPRIILNISDKGGINKDVFALSEIIVFSPDDYSVQVVSDFLTAAKNIRADSKIYLGLPVVANHDDIAEIKKILSECALDGVLADNLYGLALAEEHKLNFIAGTGLNIYNSESAKYYLSRGGNFIYSAELNLREIREIENKIAAENFSGGDVSEGENKKEGFVFVHGDIRVMTLNHCPAQVATGKDCGACGYEKRLIYEDGKGYRFPLRRVRMSKCYFELYNSAKLNTCKKLRGADFNMYFVLFRVSASRVCDIIKSYIHGSQTDGGTNESFTTGHLFKGVT